MLEFNRIIFITENDNSEGPLAAVLCKKWLPLEKIEVESRGLAVVFEEPMNPKTVAVAESNDLEIEHTSKQLQDDDFGQDVLALVLDEAKKQTVYDEYPSAVNVYTITEYVNEAGSILNPDGGDLSDYAQLYDAINEATKKVAYKLRESKFQEN